MSKRPEFKFDGHTTYCTVFYEGRGFTASTTCLPQDLDMKTDRVGMDIALQKAQIKCYKFIKNCELKPQLKCLKQLYESIRFGKEFNEHSHESRGIRRNIRLIEQDLDVINALIEIAEEDLVNYIHSKDEFYNKVRTHRANKAKTN